MLTGTELKFLSFLREETNGLREKIDITDFMVSNFTKPDPLWQHSNNSNDPSIKFLKNLKKIKFIDYEDAVLEQVNTWTYAVNGIEYKRWFDTLHEPMYVSLTDYFFESLPTIYPTTPQMTNKYVGITWLVNNLKKLSAKSIIEMTIAGLIVAFLIYWWHLNAIRGQPQRGLTRILLPAVTNKYRDDQLQRQLIIRQVVGDNTNNGISYILPVFLNIPTCIIVSGY